MAAVTERRDIYQGAYAIEFDGRVVWVNHVSGVCVGRFGTGGIDIHKDLEGQLAGGSPCLHCTHERPGAAEWDVFVKTFHEIYGVYVPPEARPAWVR